MTLSIFNRQFVDRQSIVNDSIINRQC